MASAKKMRIARNTLKRYLKLFQRIELLYPGSYTDIGFCIQQIRSAKRPNKRLETLIGLLPIIACPTVKAAWRKCRDHHPESYGYSQFAFHYAIWKRDQLWPVTCQVRDIDHLQLATWRRSHDRCKWEIAVSLLDHAQGATLVNIARKVERSPATVNEWLKKYHTCGLSAFLKKDRKIDPDRARLIAEKKADLMRLLHESPSLHGFNRTSWRLVDLTVAYQNQYGRTVSVAMVSEYIRQEGYVFRKARKTLTSTDPEFRSKLAHITGILSNLGVKEKFFSVDEYGPFSVKIKGGRSRVKRGETKTYPQHQKSKGFLICTAALELSANQITHFYSLKKDTAEMIVLIGMLIGQYLGEDKLYFSWDAASWHASKKLLAYLELINSDAYRAQYGTPAVELAPLPASAQFLNVIESVFSGLARSVIHNSDYDGVASCKTAIDRYFAERNAYFKQNPQRAGKKIWGKERTVAEFKDSHNCKDPAWR